MSDLEMIASHASHRIFSECVPPLYDKRFKMEVCEKIILEAIKQAEQKHRCTLPDSIQEALNSGDGTYKP